MAKSRQKKSAAHYRKPAIDFSVTGLIYCTMMMFIGLAAVNTQANLLFGVFGLMIGILLVSFTISGLVLRRVAVERVLPDHLIVGRPGALHYKVTNKKRFWPSLSVTVTELEGGDVFSRQPTAYMLHAANRMTATIATEVLPLRRGLVLLSRCQLSTSFPFGFIKRAVERKQEDALLVLPAMGTMRRELMRRFRSAQSSGINVRPSSGGDDEFYGVREYRSGENPRRIYWKRSAGAGPMVVREMTRVSPPKLMLLVDLRARDNSPTAAAAIERTIAMAATLIDAGMELGLPAGLVVCSGTDWIKRSPELGKRHRLELLTVLAKLPASSTVTSESLIDHARELLRSDTTAVLLTSYHSGGRAFDGQRGGMIVLSGADDPHFSFAPEIDFVTVGGGPAGA